MKELLLRLAEPDPAVRPFADLGEGWYVVDPFVNKPPLERLFRSAYLFASETAPQ